VPDALPPISFTRRAPTRAACVGLAVCSVTLAARSAEAQSPPTPVPDRSDAWNQASTILALSAVGLELVMPRVFYSDPEVSVGWKARWHLSVLAPIASIATLTLINEHHLKESLAGFRPGCDETNQGLPGCTTYGTLSSPAFAGFAAVGHGTAVFIIDTGKWSDGRFNAGAFTGEVAVPLVLSVISAAGRTSGNWESGGQVAAGAAAGFAVGLATGFLYAAMQRPECGYSGNLICW
jgi:hypothetical protein